MTKGRLIALEGIDGSGTTTQCRLLTTALQEKGYRVYATAEPSKGPIGLLLREELRVIEGKTELSPEAMALLYAADRMHHCQRELEPALLNHDFVITDRYVLSTLVYQGLKVSVDWLRELNRFALIPDKTLLLDLPVSVAQSRVKARAGVKELFDEQSMQEQLRQRYLELAQADAYVCIVNAEPLPQLVLADMIGRLCL